MNPETPNVPYLETLRAELIAGIARKRRRRTVRRRAALAAGAAAVAIPLGVAGPLDRPLGGADGGPTIVRASNALAITSAEGWIELRIVDPAADPERMTEELRAAGVDGQVCTVLAPTRAAVGAWIAVAETYTAGGVGVAADVSVFPEVALSPGELRDPPRMGEKWPAIMDEVTAKALEPSDARSARVERDVDGRKVTIRGSGRLEEVKRAAPDLIRIRADFARRPQPGTLRLFLGRASEPGERVPSDLRGSTECA